MENALEIMAQITFSVLAARGLIDVIGFRPFWWPKEPERYTLEELRIGGNCGICGEWMPKEIVPKDWPWSLCEVH